MSEASLEVLRSAYDAFRDGDLERVLEALDRDVEWDASAALAHRGVYTGRQGAQRYLEGMSSAWEDFRLEAQEFLHSVGGLYMVTGRIHGRERDTGEVVEAPFVHVVKLRRSKVARLNIFVDRAAAERHIEAQATAGS